VKKCINLFAGPGVGKSTAAAGLFHKLKSLNVNCELVNEYAKDMTWNDTQSVLEDQIYVFGKQQRRVLRLRNKVDVAICDSPTIMGLVYASPNYPQAFRDLVEWQFNQYPNMNYFLTREKPYNPAGRNQTLEQSDKLQEDIKKLLVDYKIPYTTVPGSDYGLDFILRDVKRELNIG